MDLINEYRNAAQKAFDGVKDKIVDLKMNFRQSKAFKSAYLVARV